MIIWEKEYHGFEHFYDYFRDVHEAVDETYNKNMENIPGEFQGAIKVTIEYIDENK